MAPIKESLDAGAIPYETKDEVFQTPRDELDAIPIGGNIGKVLIAFAERLPDTFNPKGDFPFKLVGGMDGDPGVLISEPLLTTGESTLEIAGQVIPGGVVEMLVVSPFGIHVLTSVDHESEAEARAEELVKVLTGGDDLARKIIGGIIHQSKGIIGESNRIGGLELKCEFRIEAFDVDLETGFPRLSYIRQMKALVESVTQGEMANDMLEEREDPPIGDSLSLKDLDF